MRQYNSNELIKAVSGEMSCSTQNNFSHVSIDSRTISDPSKTVFFAIEGKSRNGHSYIEELIRKEVRIFVVDGAYKPVSNDPTLCFIWVNNTLQALQDFAAYVRSRYNGTVIGITGSNGKTIVKEWIYQVFRNNFRIFRSPRSYNSQLGVPLSLLLLEDIYKFSVIEAGISLPGEMDKLEKMIKPDIGIITNIGETHQENFKDHKDKLREKLILFSESKLLIYRRDHVLIHETISEILPASLKLVSWGLTDESDYQVLSIKRKGNETHVRIKGVDELFRIPFIDEASVENALHVLILGFCLELKPDVLSGSLPRLEPVEMRLEILKGINSCTLISDSYNSDIRSVEISLDLLIQQNQHAKRVLILSDIFQSGKTGEELYSAIADLIKRRKVDTFIGIGQDITNHKSLFYPGSRFFNNTDEFLNSGIWSGFRDEAVLIKGSRAFEFEKITKFLQEKSHHTILEINLSSLVYNYNVFRSVLAPGTRIMAMVKAFSYGSGSYEVANKMQFHKAAYLAVAFADEGVELRKNGINLPVMVMNPDPSSFWTIVEYKLEPEIYSLAILEEFLKYADRNGLTSYPVHIKIDTGMHRLGFDKNELADLLKYIPSPLIDIVSVFSHLAATDEPEHDEFTRKQISDYSVICNAIRKKTGRDFIRHILNSSGAVRFPEAHFEMVRLGIGLYGIELSGTLPLKEVSTFKTHISMIKNVEAGESVGYGRNGWSNHSRTVATIPVGYADGISRSLGNGIGKFKVNHQIAPIIGNVCMDMCMLDVTGLEAKEGDEVIIFGPGHSVNKLAAAARTIPYEILTGIPERVKRVYLEE